MSPSPRKDPVTLATVASRTAVNGINQNASSTAPRRVSFAKIREPLEVPNLLALQTESFEFLQTVHGPDPSWCN